MKTCLIIQIFYILVTSLKRNESVAYIENRHLFKRSIVSSKNYLNRILWEKKNISFSLFGNEFSKDSMSVELVRNILKDAFKEWQENSCFKFNDVTPSARADIKIVFTNDRHKTRAKQMNLAEKNYEHQRCERKFRSHAAHAFFRYHKKYPAHIHVNNELLWIESDKIPGSLSLKSVLLHEIG